MIKIFGVFFLFFMLFLESSVGNIYSFTDLKANNTLVESIKIISRAQWWANESYRYADWPDWTQKLKEIEETKKSYTKQQLEEIEKDSGRRKEIDDYLVKNYSEENNLVSVIKEQNWRKLIWPIQKTKYVKWIIIHHTDTFYSWSLDSIRKIYKYHALNRWWGDIWYNYLIWYDWEIFEWRAWWDYVVWAHSVRNNRSTVWIAVIWDYHDKDLNEKQKKSLNNLVRHLVLKYWIDLTKKFDFQRDCNAQDCSFYIVKDSLSPIVWHRDAWNTTCPWEKIYEFLGILRENNLEFSKGLNFLANKNDTNLSFKDISWHIKGDKLTISNWDKLFFVKLDWNSLLINWKRYKFFTINPSKSGNSYIISPKIENNKFTWKFLLSVKNSKISLINEN